VFEKCTGVHYFGKRNEQMSNDSFEAMLNESFSREAGVAIGTRVRAAVVSIGAEYVFLDLGMRSEAMLPRAEVEQDGALTVAVGDTVEVVTVAVRDGSLMCARRLAQAATVDRKDDRIAIAAQVQEAFDAGMPVEGRVKESNKGGFNVDVCGMRAFCPVSQIDIVYCDQPDVHVGKTYSFQITKLDNGGREMVVSRRVLLQKEAEALKEEAWKTLSVGEVRDGVVTSLQPYGAFVNIGGVEGLLHVSEISHVRIGHPEEVLQKGQSVKVQIKDLDAAKRKISLSLKSLLDDPWDEFAAGVHAGAVLEGTVTRVVDFGAFVEVASGIEGLVHVSAMKVGERVSNPRRVVSPGQKVEVRVQEIDPDSRRVSLAMVDKDAEEEKAATESFRASASAGSSMGTLGDLMGKKLGRP